MNKKALIELVEYMPDYLRTQYILNLIDTTQLYIQNIPEIYLNDTICVHCVRVKPRDIRAVPDEFLTDIVYFEALSKYFIMVPIPAKFNNYEFYLKCVKLNASILNYISDVFKTEELCFEAFKQNYTIVSIFPKKMIIDELFCIKLIEYKADVFAFIESQYLTERLCLIAVRENGTLIQYVPAKFKTEELCNIAVNTLIKQKIKSMHLAYYIPDKFNNIKRRYEKYQNRQE
jgi:hypothetical protein